LHREKRLSMVTIVQCKTVCRNRAAWLLPVAATLEYTAYTTLLLATLPD
jgi:hypothetical protein